MFGKQSDKEPLIGPEKPYVLVIGDLMYLANQTRLTVLLL
jgi:hypothetical protein